MRESKPVRAMLTVQEFSGAEEGHALNCACELGGYSIAFAGLSLSLSLLREELSTEVSACHVP